MSNQLKLILSRHFVLLFISDKQPQLLQVEDKMHRFLMCQGIFHRKDLPNSFLDRELNLTEISSVRYFQSVIYKNLPCP